MIHRGGRYPEGGRTDRERGRENSVPYRLVLGGDRCSCDDITVCVAVCWGVLQSAAVFCSVLQCEEGRKNSVPYRVV